MNKNYSLFAWIQVVWLRIFLSIDDTVDRLERESPEAKQEVEQKYNKLTAAYSSLKESIKKKAGDAVGGIGKAIGSVKNVTRNAFDNTVGYGIAKYQNAKTVRALASDPQTDAQIVYLMHGLYQNEGGQWRLAKQLRKEGKVPYHLKGNHGLGIEGSAEKAFEQIYTLHDKTDLYEPHKREDQFSGHSSGANTGRYMSGDPRIREVGITERVQGRSGTHTGMGRKTFWQKLMSPLAKGDDVRTYEGRKQVVEMAKRKPLVPYQSVAYENDSLVLPEEALDKDAADHNIVEGPNATHFGSSGGDYEMNRTTIELLNKPRSEFKTFESEGSNVTSMSDYYKEREKAKADYHARRAA